MKQQENGRCPDNGYWEPLLYDYIDGIQDENARAAVDKHLSVCPYCRGELEKLRQMRGALRAFGAETESVSVYDKVMGTVMAEAAERKREILPQEPEEERILVPKEEKPPIRKYLLRAGGIAALFLCVVGLWLVTPALTRQTAGKAPSGLEDAQMLPFIEEDTVAVYLWADAEPEALTAALAAFDSGVLTEDGVVFPYSGELCNQIRAALLEHGISASLERTGKTDGFLYVCTGK